MKKEDISLLVLRLVFGGSMLFSHGWEKMIQLLGDQPIRFADPIGLGAPFSLGLTVFAEVGCSLFLIVGLFTKWVTIPLMITMLVAFFIVHGTDPFAKKEMAFLYLSVYVVFAIRGPGQYSLDKQLGFLSKRN